MFCRPNFFSVIPEAGLLFRRLLLSLTVLLPALAAAAPAIEPVPYTASYAVSYRGLSAGRVHFRLQRVEPGLFVYETSAEPSFFTRALIGSEALERSVMRIDADGVRPLSWFVEDGKRGHRNDGRLVFDWETGKVHGTVKGGAVELATVPNLQDRLSVQIAVMTALLRGVEPGTIPMMSDAEIRRYTYTRGSEERIRTSLGEFATVRYESTRPGSSRRSRLWAAPGLGYLPVRAEQLRKGKIETVVELIGVERAENAGE